jgi:hypothetical protein
MRPDMAKVDVWVEVDLVAKAPHVRKERHVLAAKGAVVGVFAEHMRDRVEASGEDQLGGFLRKLLHHLALYAGKAKTESLNLEAAVIVCFHLGCFIEHVNHKLGRHLLGGICRPDAFQLGRQRKDGQEVIGRPNDVRVDPEQPVTVGFKEQVRDLRAGRGDNRAAVDHLLIERDILQV